MVPKTGWTNELVAAHLCFWNGEVQDQWQKCQSGETHKQWTRSSCGAFFLFSWWTFLSTSEKNLSKNNTRDEIWNCTCKNLKPWTSSVKGETLLQLRYDQIAQIPTWNRYVHRMICPSQLVLSFWHEGYPSSVTDVRFGSLMTIISFHFATWEQSRHLWHWFQMQAKEILLPVHGLMCVVCSKRLEKRYRQINNNKHLACTLHGMRYM